MASAGAAGSAPPPLAASAAEAVSEGLTERVAAASSVRVPETHLCVGVRYQGKVRDVYELDDEVLFVATDRLSAFDRSLAVVPLKGAVLNQISAWWFKQLADVCPSHLVRTVDPNAVMVRRCKVFPVEVVVRGFITGSTSTSLWTHYKGGAREYCGIAFPDGLRKNDRLPEPVLTPTTKEPDHDRPISPADIVAEGWMEEEDWKEVADAAMRVFAEGQRVAASHGLLLVDTKYEFGRAPDGRIVLVDEVHTPDSSRYWLASTYEARHAAGEEPENIDKEFMRLWYRQRCDPYADAVVPEAPEALVRELSRRYVLLYEMITGQRFDFEACAGDASGRIRDAIAGTHEVEGKAVVRFAGSHGAAKRAEDGASEGAVEAYTCTTAIKAAEAARSVQQLRAACPSVRFEVFGAKDGEAGLSEPDLRAALGANGIEL